MPDPRLTHVAQTLVRYSTNVRPGDRVAIYAGLPAEPLAAEVFREVLHAGGYPYPLLGYDSYLGMGGFDEIFFREANEDQIRHISGIEAMTRGELEVMIIIRAPRNTRNLTGVDPARRALRSRAGATLLDTFMQRTARGELRWCFCLYPTLALAQDAEMSLEAFEDFTFGAMFADEADPVATWQAMRAEQQRVIDWLAGRKRIEVRGADAQLTLSVEGRTFINCDGSNNLPDGEVFTGPVEDSVEGWVRFTYPLVFQGVSVEGIELAFEKGRVARASACHNGPFLLSLLDTDAGSRYVGEWAIGTNRRVDRFTGEILLDEKIGGTMHLALGAGYPETGSKNVSGIHRDMICDLRQGAQILADGDLFYESGRFLI
jgi:aminopeptidase